VHLMPYAYDDFDGEISSATISYSGNATSVITITPTEGIEGQGLLKVADDAPNGIYHLLYSASDTAGSPGTETRVIVVADKVAPDLTLLGETQMVHEAGTTWTEPGFLANDAVDGNLTSAVSISGTVGNSPKTYYLTYSVSDNAGNIATSTRTVIVVDSSPPVLTLEGNASLSLYKGSVFADPGYTAIDAFDGDLTSDVLVSGEVETEIPGTYLLSYRVEDSSGLSANATRVVEIEDWAYTLSGKAMDGYLVGATVIFDVDGNGTHDLSVPVTTDESGAFTLSFTQEDLAKIDQNGNGVVDFSEGKIKVFGGRDASTNQSFNGLYEADANSTVVNPLTTLVSALLDQNLTRQDAVSKVAETLGVPGEVDILNHDPISAAADGEATSSDTLTAVARMANVIRQADAFVGYLSDDALQSKVGGPLFVAEMAKKIANGQSPVINDAPSMQQLLADVAEKAGLSANLSTDDLTGATELLVAADGLILEAKASKSSPTELAVTLAKVHAVVEDGIVEGYGNGDTPLSLSESQTKESMSGQMESLASINVFAPDASDAETYLPSNQWSLGFVVHQVGGVDADGDSIHYTIDSGNPDADKDGSAAFSVEVDGRLILQDPTELSGLSSASVNLQVKMTDGKGLVGTASISVKLGNALALETETQAQAGWRRSDWLGNFFANSSSWIFHEILGWLYVSRDGSGGYWLWSPSRNAWLWTSSDAYPYMYRHEPANWLYLDYSTRRELYDFSTNQWINP